MKSPRTKLSLGESIASDYYRFTGRRGNAFIHLTQALLLRYCSFTYTYWLRVAQQGRGPLKWLGILMHRHYSHKFGIDIGRGIDVGAGFYLSHGCCIIINSRTRIGNNVNVSQFVNIGTNDGRAAVIGDNVYIGPNACIVGGVHIGNDVTIGAGSVVTGDVPDGATVVGVPARVVNSDNPGRYILNRYTPDKA